jgi:integrase
VVGPAYALGRLDRFLADHHVASFDQQDPCWVMAQLVDRMVAWLEPRYQNLCQQILLIPRKRWPRWPLDCLDKREVDTIFAGADTQTADGYRDLCILRTLYNTAARASELRAIRVADLDFHQKRVLLQGKGSKARTVPMWDSTLAFLRTYLKSQRRVPRFADRNFLFINQRRTRLTRFGLYLLCRHYLTQARASNTKRCTPSTSGVTPPPATCCWRAWISRSSRSGWGTSPSIPPVAIK